MKARLLAVMIAALALSGVTSAQNYSIRVAFNTNLRTSNSLNGRIVETAPAGTTLNVNGESNRWLRINRNGATVWMASWVRHERVEATTTTQRQTVSNIDNCCFVDRQCSTDQEWTDGYWAFQNGQCAAPVQTQTQTQASTQTKVSTQPVTSTAPVTIPAGVDNCCQVNRQCHSDDDWIRGYHDFQNNQCAGVAPSASTAPITGPIPEDVDNCCFVNRQCHTEQDYIIGYEQFKYGLCHVPDIAGVINISGSGAFVSKTRAALRILLDKEPKWYRYVQSTLRGVKEIPMGGDSGIFPDEAVYRSWPNFRSDRTGEGHIIWVAGQLVHEACHVHRYKAGLESGGYAGEKACTETQIQALDDIDASGAVAASRRRALANIDDPEHQWWRFH